MNTLAAIRTNIFYSKKKKESKNSPDEFVKHQELVFIINKPSYRHTNEGDVIRERSVEELRFVVDQESMTQLIKLLDKLKDVDESELG